MLSMRKDQRMGRRRSIAVTITFALAILSNVAIAAPTSAATGWDRCPDGYLCVFEHFDGLGDYAYFQTDQSDLTQPVNGVVLNDKISSVWDRTSETYGWCFYRHVGFRDPLFLLAGDNKSRTNVPRSVHDQASSIDIGRGCADAIVLSG